MTISNLPPGSEGVNPVVPSDSKKEVGKADTSKTASVYQEVRKSEAAETKETASLGGGKYAAAFSKLLNSEMVKQTPVLKHSTDGKKVFEEMQEKGVNLARMESEDGKRIYIVARVLVGQRDQALVKFNDHFAIYSKKTFNWENKRAKMDSNQMTSFEKLLSGQPCANRELGIVPGKETLTAGMTTVNTIRLVKTVQSM